MRFSWPVPDIELERRRLDQAERFVVAGEMRVASQRLRILQLEANGSDGQVAVTELGIYERALETLNRQRALVLNVIPREDEY